MSVQAVAGEIGEALAHMCDHGVELDFGAGLPLPLVERGLTGAVGGWARPATAPPPDAEDLEGASAHARVDELVEAFAEHLENETGVCALLVEYGPWVAHAFMTSKLECREGELHRITSADLSEYLLDHAPRKGASDEATLMATPPGLVAFLRFLADEDGRVGEVPVEELVAAVERHASAFDVANRDPRRWDPGQDPMVARPHAPCRRAEAGTAPEEQGREGLTQAQPALS